MIQRVCLLPMPHPRHHPRLPRHHLPRLPRHRRPPLAHPLPLYIAPCQCHPLQHCQPVCRPVLTSKLGITNDVKRSERRRRISRLPRYDSQSKRYQGLNYVKTSFSALSLPVTRAGFIGKRSKVIAQHRTLESYLEEGFQIVPWDGK